MRKNWKPISIFIALLAMFITVEIYSEKPIDWTPTYSRTDKIPYGNYLLYEMLPNLFPLDIFANEKTLYENRALLNGTDNIIIISHTLNKMDSLEQQLLFNHVAQGAKAFIASSTFSNAFKDSLQFETERSFYYNDTIALTSNLEGIDTNFIYQNRFINQYFSEFDSSQTTILGRLDTIGANFLKIPHEKGEFYLHASPQLFSNYNMVYENNHLYIEKALTYLPNKSVIWDEYYNVIEPPKDSIYLIRENKALNTARLLLIVGLFLYAIFYGKRLQRIIPIVVPPRNHTMEFIKSVASLYFFKHDNKNLVEKRFSYFSEFIKSNYGFVITETNKKGATKFSQHLEIPYQLAERFFAQITHIRTKSNIDDLALTEFNESLERIYTQLKKRS